MYVNHNKRLVAREARVSRGTSDYLQAIYTPGSDQLASDKSGQGCEELLTSIVVKMPCEIGFRRHCFSLILATLTNIM